MAYDHADTQPIPDPDESTGPIRPQVPPEPWYRRRSLLAAWAALAAILVALIVVGLFKLSTGGGAPAPTTSTTSSVTSATTTSTTPPTTATSTTTTATSTTPSTTPTTTTTVAPPTAPPPAPPPRSNAPAEPTDEEDEEDEVSRIPKLPLPSTITLPEIPTVITLPPGI